MTDEVAGAALIALGPQLEWGACSTGRDWESDMFFPNDSEYAEWYTIEYIAEFDRAYYQGGRYGYGRARRELCATEFHTLAAAKAACERHHATGTWG